MKKLVDLIIATGGSIISIIVLLGLLAWSAGQSVCQFVLDLLYLYFVLV